MQYEYGGIFTCNTNTEASSHAIRIRRNLHMQYKGHTKRQADGEVGGPDYIHVGGNRTILLTYWTYADMNTEQAP